jgi:hypothetical protein
VTHRFGRRYEEYLSLVDGVRGIGIEGPGDFHGLAREIAYFLVDLQPPVSGVKINKETKITWIRTFCFATVQLWIKGR